MKTPPGEGNGTGSQMSESGSASDIDVFQSSEGPQIDMALKEKEATKSLLMIGENLLK